MPLQTTFGSKVTLVETTQRHGLGTIRIEGSKVYKYMKAGGTIHDNDGCSMSASGTVVVTGANLKCVGINSTGSTLASGDYFWMQVAGETNAFDSSGATAVGYPLYTVNATGLMSGSSSSATAVGNSTITVDNATGYALLSGLL